MKPLFTHIFENLEDEKNQAESLIDKIREVVLKLQKAKKSDVDGHYTKNFNDAITLCNSAIESIDFSMQIDESAEDIQAERPKPSKEVEKILQHVQVIVEQIKSLAKSAKSLNYDIRDAKVDMINALNELQSMFDE